MPEQERPNYEACTCSAQLESSCKYMIVYGGKKPPFFYCTLQPKTEEAFQHA
jgi:hypothetical protein